MKSRDKINGGFVVLPKNTLRCRQWRELEHCGKIVYWAVLTEFIRDKKINPDNKVKITQKQIEDMTGQSHPTVVSGIKALKKLCIPLIHRVSHPGKRHPTCTPRGL